MVDVMLLPEESITVANIMEEGNSCQVVIQIVAIAGVVVDIQDQKEVLDQRVMIA